MKNLLITGGAGTLGTAIAKFVLASDMAERVCILSRGEHRQAALREELGNDPRLRLFIGDVRDVYRLQRAFEGVDTVIHAAALKRIEVGHYDPEEMVRTNVLGAMNVVQAARYANVQRVVATSTDKAFQPISPYGQSKALAESIFLAANQTQGTGPSFVVARYGNVAGSAGSVIPRWRERLNQGLGGYVTDADCTRFWMTLDQAVALVLDLAKANTLFTRPVTPCLPAYRLGDLAQAMGMTFAGAIGLPNYEKKHESMSEGNSSEYARRMSVDELREALKTV